MDIMSYKGGTTNFEPLFDEAARIAQYYIDNSIIVFIFMTDGFADYPIDAIQDLKKIKLDYPDKFHYAGIQFKCNQPVMKRIAT